MKRTDSLYPWERQPGESEKAYEAFLVFKNAGPGRTIISVSRKLQKSYTIIRRWYKAWDWKTRVEAFDRENDRAEQERLQKEHVAMLKRHMKISTAVQAKALKALEGMEPEELRPADIRDFLRYGVELEKETRGSESGRAQEGQQADTAHMLAEILEKAWEGGETDGES